MTDALTEVAVDRDTLARRLARRSNVAEHCFERRCGVHASAALETFGFDLGAPVWLDVQGDFLLCHIVLVMVWVGGDVA
jgi:hypothetical protein